MEMIVNLKSTEEGLAREKGLAKVSFDFFWPSSNELALWTFLQVIKT